MVQSESSAAYVIPSLVAKGETFINRTTVNFGDKVWLLKAENIRATQFGLYDGGTRLGGITPGAGSCPWDGATIDMPDALPLDVQVFMTSIVLSKWGEPNTYGAPARVVSGFAPSRRRGHKQAPNID